MGSKIPNPAPRPDQLWPDGVPHPTSPPPPRVPTTRPAQTEGPRSVRQSDAVARPTELPPPGSEWIHKSSNRYTVLAIANENTERPGEYPVTVVYRRQSDGTTWSRPLSRWHSSMSPAESRRAFVVFTYTRPAKYAPLPDGTWEKRVLVQGEWRWDDNVSSEAAAAELSGDNEVFIAPDPRP